MTERVLMSLSYAVPGAVVAGLALHAAVSLSALFTDLKSKATEQETAVPPLAALYFRNTVRVLFATGVGFLLTATADCIASLAAQALVAARILGYGSGFLMLVCGFSLLLQSSVDRQLKLMSARMRWAQLGGGLLGVLAAAWGMILVTMQGGIWLR